MVAQLSLIIQAERKAGTRGHGRALPILVSAGLAGSLGACTGRTWAHRNATGVGEDESTLLLCQYIILNRFSILLFLYSLSFMYSVKCALSFPKGGKAVENEDFYVWSLPTLDGPLELTSLLGTEGMLNKALLIGKEGRNSQPQGTYLLKIHGSSLVILTLTRWRAFPTLVFGAARHHAGVTGQWSSRRPHVSLKRGSNPFSDTEERTLYTYILI